MGTHDLDSVEGPFRYEALPPRDIKFVPLAQTREFDAADLMEFYETDASVKHIKPYVSIIKDSPVYPVVLDAQRRVMSLPPIINGELSKMSKETRNIFIEVTATDLVKAKTVLNQLVRGCHIMCGWRRHLSLTRALHVFRSRASRSTARMRSLWRP